MLHLHRCVVSVLTGPDADIHAFLTFQQQLIVDILQIGPLEDLLRVVLEGRLDHERGVGDVFIVYSVLVEGFDVLVHMPEDPIQVENA